MFKNKSKDKVAMHIRCTFITKIKFQNHEKSDLLVCPLVLCCVGQMVRLLPTRFTLNKNMNSCQFGQSMRASFVCSRAALSEVNGVGATWERSRRSQRQSL